MRRPVTAERVEQFLSAAGKASKTDVTCFLTGGATAVLMGWRETTLDIDILLEPDDTGLLRRIVELKDELGLSIELASPGDFIPLPAGWRDRSPFAARHGLLTARHFDPYAQALAKIERAHPHDVEDVAQLIARGLVDRERLRALYEEIEPELFRFPAIDPPTFRKRLSAALADPAAKDG